MRTLFTAIILVLLVNALALGGLFGWLGATGRLDKERVREAVAVFSNTIREQEALEAEQAAAEQDAIEMAEQAMRMQQVAGGPVTPDELLESIRRVDETQQAMVKRREVEIQSLLRQLDLRQRRIEEKLAELNAKQQAFDEAVEAQIGEMEEEDFKEAVAMLEGIPAKQAKAVFQQMLRQGERDQVVSYLSAMEERKAAGVLKEFKQPNEVPQAAELIEQLRQRTDQLKQEADL